MVCELWRPLRSLLTCRRTALRTLRLLLTADVSLPSSWDSRPRGRRPSAIDDCEPSAEARSEAAPEVAAAKGVAGDRGAAASSPNAKTASLAVRAAASLAAPDSASQLQVTSSEAKNASRHAASVVLPPPPATNSQAFDDVTKRPGTHLGFLNNEENIDTLKTPQLKTLRYISKISSEKPDPTSDTPPGGRSASPLTWRQGAHCTGALTYAPVLQLASQACRSSTGATVLGHSRT